MPLYDDVEPGSFPRVSRGFEPAAPRVGGSAGEVLGAAFERENELVAGLMALRQERDFKPEAGYSAFNDQDLLNSKYIDQYGDRFVGVRSKAEAASIRQRIDHELDQSRLIEGAGMWGTAASMAAGVLAPSTFIPGGQIVRAGRTAERIGQSALSVGTAAAVGTAVQEGALHAVQETRTPEESAWAIGLSGVMGAGIGAAAGGFSPKLASRLGSDLSGETAPDMRPIAFGGGGAQSVGAAAVTSADTSLARIPGVDTAVSGATFAARWAARKAANAGRWAVGRELNSAPIQGSTFAEVSSFMTPLLRMQTSEAEAARQAVATLADPGGVRLKANTEAGGFQPAIPGGSVEVRAKTQIDSILARYTTEMDGIYQDYWKSVGGSDGLSGKIGIMSNAAKQATIGGDGPLSPSQFFELVGRAIRIDDGQTGDQFVTRAAALQKKYQEGVISLLPEDIRPDVTVGPKFAGGYLPRLFNQRAIAARAGDFEETVFRNMLADQERKAVLQGRAEQATAQMADLAAQEKRLQGRLETAGRRRADAESRVNEMEMAARRGQKRLETADARVWEIEKDISDLETEVSAAKGDRDYSKADLANLNQELKSLRQEREAVLRQAKKQPKGAPIEEADIAPDASMRTIVDYVTGAKNPPRAPSFLRWVINQGGVKGDRGEITSIFGQGNMPRGLARENGKSLQDLAQAYSERIGRENHLADQVGYRLEESEMLEYLRQAAGGQEPPNWRDGYSDALRARVELYDAAADIPAEMQRLGLDSSDRNAVLSYIRGHAPDELPGRAAGPDELSDIPIDSVELYKGMDELAAGLQSGIARSERLIKALRSKIEARDKAGARQSGRQGEALTNVNSSRSRLSSLLDRAELYASLDDNLAKELEQLGKTKENVRGQLEKIVTEWEGDTVREAKSALKQVAKQAEERNKGILAGTYEGRNGRLTGADAAVDKAIGQITKSERSLSEAELRTQARDVTVNMMASPDGRLPYEWGSTAARQQRSAGGMGDEVDIPFLKERKFPVPDAEMLDVLENDVRAVFHAYLHSTVPQAEMHRMFGDVRGESAIRAIQEEYADRIAQASTEKERLDLQKSMNDDLRDFNGMRDRILGVYAQASDTSSLFHRGANIARQMNFLSKMGMMVVSSVADAGGIILRNGVGRSGEALTSSLNRLSKDLDKASAAEKAILQDAGVGLDYILGSRSLSLNEITNDFGRNSKFERSLTSATAGFSYFNLSRQWDSGMQTIAGIATLRRIMRNAEQWSTGGVAKKAGDSGLAKGEAEWMASLNIGQDQARRIWQQAKAGEGERVSGVLIPEGRTWSDTEAYDTVRFALKQAVDSTIIKPGQDKPLWMSTSTGKVIGQFRSFTIAAHQRILLAGLQQADANMAQGVVTMLALGMTSVALSDLFRDGKLKERAGGEWFVEGFDRSGLAGWLMEINNVGEKVSGQQFGLRPLGGQQPAARTLNQSKADAIFGPTLGFATDLTRIAGAALKQDELTRGDLRAVRNQVPGQNLFWLRWVFSQVQEGGEKALDIYEPPKRTQ